MRFVLWSGCHRVSDPLTTTQISINQKLCGLADLGRCLDWVLEQFNNGVRCDNDENNARPCPDCHMLQVSNKVSCLPTLPATFSTFQTNLQGWQLCWYWDTMLQLQPSITGSCRLSNNLNHNQNIQKSTQSADRTVDMFLGLLRYWDCDKMNVENFSRKVVVCWYPTRRYWLDISDYTRYIPRVFTDGYRDHPKDGSSSTSHMKFWQEAELKLW